MPQRVLAKFVKFIIFQQQQAGFLADATPAMIAIKEKAIWRLIDQVKVLQQMNMTFDKIVGRIGTHFSAESEFRPVSINAASSNLLS
jgi:hypothetical protein